MLFLILATMLGVAEPTVCAEGCVPGGCYTLVLRWRENIAAPGEVPKEVTRETFTETNYPTVEDALCGARKMRQDGAVVPVDAHGGAPGNVMPDSITPMRAL